jgi:hypothetical protein
MDDFVIFDESCLRKIGVTCPACHTEVVFDVSNEREPHIVMCPGCHKNELLNLMGIELLRAEFPEKFTWVTLHKWIRDHAKDITLRLYFRQEQGKTDVNPWREAGPALTAASVR